MAAPITFLESVVSIGAGIALMDTLRAMETKELTKKVMDSMITPDEKAVIEELSLGGGALTQSEIVRRTALSKVKVHRILRRLEQLGIISKYPYGVTNKIVLEESQP